MKTFAVMLMLSLGLNAFAQSGAESPSPRVHFYHQIFMNDTIRSVEKVEYAKDSCAIDYRLSDDGTTIYLLDYDGVGSIKIYYTTKVGDPKDVQKPHCQVQDLRLEL